jgi:Apea-like HEPN
MGLPHSPQTPLEDSVAQLVGTPFLAYICNCEKAQVERYLESGEGLDEAQRAAVFQALELAHAILKQELGLRTPATRSPSPVVDSLARLCVYVEEEEVGLASAWRPANGGVVPRFESKDPLGDALLTLARDLYPALLLPAPAPEPFTSNPFPRSIALTQSHLGLEHPASKDFLAALGDSEPLAALFAERPVEEMTDTKQMTSRSGRGGAAQAGFLTTSLLVNAEPRTRLAGELTLDGYLQAVSDELAVARALASGEEALVPAAIGLQSVTVPDGFRLETPWGLLRQPDPWQKRWAPVGADLVLITPFPMAVDIHAPNADGTPIMPDLAFFEPQRKLEQTIDQLRLALLLASDSEAPVALRSTWRFIPDPFQLPGFNWNVDQALQLGGSIDDDDVRGVECWTRLVAERFDGKLDLATRRLLRAFTNRLSSEDGLVDATIALESLFGSRSSRTIRPHLGKVLNRLLGGDSETRDERHRLVWRLYDRRKDVVHGGHLEPTEAEETRTEATRLVTEAMRTLIAERADLIGDDSRGERLASGE